MSEQNSCAQSGLPLLAPTEDGEPHRYGSPGCAFPVGGLPGWAAVLPVALIVLGALTSTYGQGLLLLGMGMPVLICAAQTRPIGYALADTLLVIGVWAYYGSLLLGSAASGSVSPLSDAPFYIMSTILLWLSLEAMAMRSAGHALKQSDASGPLQPLLDAYGRFPPATANTVLGVARFFCPLALLVAGLIGCRAGYLHGYQEGVARGLTVLLIATPGLLRLIVPVCTARAYRAMTAKGVAIHDGCLFEELPIIEAYALDQAAVVDPRGTRVVDIMPGPKTDEAELLTLAASLLAESDLPGHRAVVREAEARGIQCKEVTDVHSAPGEGISGTVQVSLRQSRDVRVASFSQLRELKVKLPKDDFEDPEFDHSEPLADVSVAAAGRYVGTIWVAYGVQSGAKELVLRLGHKRWMKKRRVTHLMTSAPGDAARQMARLTGASDVAGSVSRTEEKRAIVERYQNDLKPVCMVGDPITDTEALDVAAVPIAIPSTASPQADESAECLATLPERSLEGMPELAECCERVRMSLSYLQGWVLAYYGIGLWLAVTGTISPFQAAILSLAATAVTAFVPPLYAASE